MATTPARMQQRRRTAAQWTSENPVLAVGEIGVQTGGTQPLIKVGDGTTAWNSLPFHALIDFFRLSAGAGLPTGTATATVSNSWGGLLLPAAGTSGVVFAQSFPSTWTTASLSWGYVPLASGNGGVRWRARIYRVNALGFGDLISDAPQVEQLVTDTAGNQFVMDHVFNTPSGFEVHNSDAVLGEVVNIAIDRLGDDAADTAGDVMLTNFSVNRVS